MAKVAVYDMQGGQFTRIYEDGKAEVPLKKDGSFASRAFMKGHEIHIPMPSCKAAELDLHIQATIDAKIAHERTATLMAARREEADALLANADFGSFEVAGVSGWTSEGDYWSCMVFLVPDGDHSGESIEIRFGIEFDGTEGTASFTLPFSE